MSEDVMLRTPAAAKYLSVSPATLAKWRVTGSGPRYRKLGRVVVYDLLELLAWAQERSRSSTSEARPKGVDVAQRAPLGKRRGSSGRQAGSGGPTP